MNKPQEDVGFISKASQDGYNGTLTAYPESERLGVGNFALLGMALLQFFLLVLVWAVAQMGNVATTSFIPRLTCKKSVFAIAGAQVTSLLITMWTWYGRGDSGTCQPTEAIDRRVSALRNHTAITMQQLRSLKEPPSNFDSALTLINFFKELSKNLSLSTFLQQMHMIFLTGLQVSFLFFALAVCVAAAIRVGVTYKKHVEKFANRRRSLVITALILIVGLVMLLRYVSVALPVIGHRVPIGVLADTSIHLPQPHNIQIDVGEDVAGAWRETKSSMSSYLFLSSPLSMYAKGESRAHDFDTSFMRKDVKKGTLPKLDAVVAQLQVLRELQKLQLSDESLRGLCRQSFGECPQGMMYTDMVPLREPVTEEVSSIAIMICVACGMFSVLSAGTAAVILLVFARRSICSSSIRMASGGERTQQTRRARKGTRSRRRKINEEQGEKTPPPPPAPAHSPSPLATAAPLEPHRPSITLHRSEASQDNAQAILIERMFTGRRRRKHRSKYVARNDLAPTPNFHNVPSPTNIPAPILSAGAMLPLPAPISPLQYNITGATAPNPFFGNQFFGYNYYPAKVNDMPRATLHYRPIAQVPFAQPPLGFSNRTPTQQGYPTQPSPHLGQSLFAPSLTRPAPAYTLPESPFPRLVGLPKDHAGMPSGQMVQGTSSELQLAVKEEDWQSEVSFEPMAP